MSDKTVLSSESNTIPTSSTETTKIREISMTDISNLTIETPPIETPPIETPPIETPSIETPFVASTELAITDAELLALCKERFCIVCDEKVQANDRRLRNLAEMDNFKKRLNKKQEEFRKYIAENILTDLLPVLDNLDLALEHGRKVEACKDIIFGVDITRKIFLDILANYGLIPIGEIGEIFDPTQHEAVDEETRTDLAPGTICSIMQRGYLLRERLLRPARVTVNKIE